MDNCCWYHPTDRYNRDPEMRNSLADALAVTKVDETAAKMEPTAITKRDDRLGMTTV
jgi:hypothetical protein